MTQVMAMHLVYAIMLHKYKIHEEPLSVEKEIKYIKNLINPLITSQDPLEKSISKLLPQIFDVRCKLLKLILEQGIDLQQTSELTLIELEKLFSQLKDHDEVILFENTKFVLKTFDKVFNSITAKFPSWIEQMRKVFEKGITLSYEQLRYAIELEPLHEHVKSLIINFIDTSLSLELAFVMAVLFILNEYKLPKPKIVELSRVLRDRAQEYGAMAIKLQLWKPKIEKIPYELPALTPEEIEEEQRLSDADISDYLRQLIEEERGE